MTYDEENEKMRIGEKEIKSMTEEEKKKEASEREEHLEKELRT